MEENKQVSVEETPTGQVMSQRTTTSSVTAANRGYFKAYYLVYYILGVIEVLLAFRFVFKLLGANSSSGFVSFIYSITGLLAAPFLGIFHVASTRGVEAISVFEPATIIAMIVYAIAAWGLAKLIAVLMAGKS